jgi:L-asparaginase
LIIHGGAGRGFKDDGRKDRVRASLHRIARDLWDRLETGSSADEVVAEGCRQLEDDTNFNAGTGSVLQADGQVRMSAAFMNGGVRPAFSGVINVQRVRNPIELAHALQTQRDRVLDASGAADLAREIGLGLWDPVVERRLLEWIEERRGNFDIEHAGLIAEPEFEPEFEPGTGTIGVVVLDDAGHIAAGTSTGGRGFERVGRVSDSATPAGNFANSFAGASATGIGEDILDEALASTVVVRAADSESLLSAMQRTMTEAAGRSRTFGAIGVSRNGEVVWGKTTELLLCAYHDGAGIHDTLDASTDVEIRSVHRETT